MYFCGEGLPTSTMKFEPSRIKMIPQYLMVNFKSIEKLKKKKAKMINFVALKQRSTFVTS